MSKRNKPKPVIDTGLIKLVPMTEEQKKEYRKNVKWQTYNQKKRT